MYKGEDEVQALFCGEQGIAAAAVGDETVYKRRGGVVYLTLQGEHQFAEKE